MKNYRKRVIKGDDLQDEETINNIFRTLMDFPEWDGERMDEWIDMLSLTNPANKTVPRFHAQHPEHFEIEIQGADLVSIKPQQITSLMRRVSVINRRYQARMGSSIISVIVT